MAEIDGAQIAPAEITCDDVRGILELARQIRPDIGECQRVELSENLIYAVTLASGTLQIPRNVLERWRATGEIDGEQVRQMVEGFAPAV